MSKLPSEIKATLSYQKEQLLDLIDQAKLLEFLLLESFGENRQTILTLDQLTEIADQARDRLSRLSADSNSGTPKLSGNGVGWNLFGGSDC
jgi:hypothetical protein